MTDVSDVIGAWSHSHEEDHEGVQVFRPADRELPPSRGRSSFTLGPDSTAVAETPGPLDSGLTTDGGTWKLEGDVLSVDCPGWSATYEVLAADPDHLELRPIQRH